MMNCLSDTQTTVFEKFEELKDLLSIFIWPRLEMAQDDHKQKSGNNSSGSGNNKSSKKHKQKKIPQRGLGVAQLEKIRLEEQQKKDIDLQSVLRKNDPILAPSFRQNPVSQTDKPLPDPDFKSNHELPKSFSKFLNMGQNTWGNCKMWNGEQILEGESYRFDQSASFDFRPNKSVIYDSVPVLAPSTNGISRKEMFQQLNSTSPMMKVSSGSSSSSVKTYNQIEPPSNQSFYSKLLTSSKWPEEEKMIGVKRPYPFSLDHPPGPTFPCKFPPVNFQYPISQATAKSPSCANGGIVHAEPRKPPPREVAACINVMNEMKTEKVTRQKGDLNGDFLTLALPKPQISHPEVLESGPNLQENVDGKNIFSFFPCAENGEMTSTITSCSGDVAEKLDLNLKL